MSGCGETDTARTEPDRAAVAGHRCTEAVSAECSQAWHETQFPLSYWNSSYTAAAAAAAAAASASVVCPQTDRVIVDQNKIRLRWTVRFTKNAGRPVNLHVAKNICHDSFHTMPRVYTYAELRSLWINLTIEGLIQTILHRHNRCILGLLYC